MLKKLRIALIMLMLACITAGVCIFTACGGDGGGNNPPDNNPPDGGTQTVAVESVSLNKNSLTLEEGASETLTVTVLPNNATNKSVTWSSSAEAVATVSDGRVTAVAEGTATITAAAGGKSATCMVTVNKKSGGEQKPVAVESVSLNKNSLTLEEGASETLTAEVLPNNATNKTVTWTSSAEAVATVANGKITAHASGVATITATAGGKSATCTVTVNQKYIFVESISLDETEITLEIDGEKTLHVIFNPANATDKSVKWSSQNKGVATVTEGKVTAMGEGRTLIIAEVGQHRAACTVTVNPPPVLVESISVNKEELTLEVGKEEILTANVLPADAVNKKVTWTSSNLNIAKVNDSTGKVTAVAEGKATITATAGGKSASCTVTVIPEQIPVESISLDGKDTLRSGETSWLTVTILPDEAFETPVTWKSSNTDIVTVNSDGDIVGGFAGTATITATAGGKSATFKVTVTGYAFKYNKDDDTCTLIAGSNLTEEDYVNGRSGIIEIPVKTWNGKIIRDIADNAFKGHNELVSVGLPYTLKSVGSYAFANCVNLENFGSYYDAEMAAYEYEGMSIGDYAFNGCTKLYEVYDADVILRIGKNAFSKCKELTVLNLWNVDVIGDSAFEGCSSIKEFRLAVNLDVIGEKAFKDCIALEEVGMSESYLGSYELRSIGKFAFDGCKELLAITLPYDVTVIEDYTFSSCSKLAEVTILGKLTTIGMEAFSYCKALESIELPDTLQTIKSGAFTQSGLTEIVIPESVTTIGPSVFTYCTKLTKAEISAQITSVSNLMFQGCTQLSEVTLPETVESIGMQAFFNCSSLVKINYGGTAEQWDGITKGNNWNNNTGNYVVQCNGKKLDKEGNEIQ